MLKDKNGKWVGTLEISEEIWKKMIEETIHGVIAFGDLPKQTSAP